MNEFVEVELTAVIIIHFHDCCFAFVESEAGRIVVRSGVV
tara:strand:+ start:198 stop:317 length:120 start_codon:yes stop_codon:yes gene_type:complete